MDELDIKGSRYISSKRASELTGYAKDYVGQLAREGKILGTRVGRAWYIDETSLLEHAKTDFSGVPFDISSHKSAAPKISIPVSEAVTGIQKTWSPIRYMEDDRSLIPELRSTHESEPVIEIKNVVPVTHNVTFPNYGEVESQEASENEVVQIRRPQTIAHYDAAMTGSMDGTIEAIKTPTAARITTFRAPQQERSRSSALIPTVTTFMAVLMVAVSLIGVVATSRIQINKQNISTASVYLGYEYLKDIAE